MHELYSYSKKNMLFIYDCYIKYINSIDARQLIEMSELILSIYSYDILELMLSISYAYIQPIYPFLCIYKAYILSKNAFTKHRACLQLRANS